MADVDARVVLGEIIERLNEAQLGQLLQIAGSLLTPIERGINYAAGYVTAAFAEEFEARLQAHHGTHTKQLDRVGLEDAFRAASLRTGRRVHGAFGATHRFVDEVIAGERTAIKSTAAKDVRDGFVHISKLCEAAWIQDVRGAQMRAERTKQQVREYLSEVDRLFQMRLLPSGEMWRYQLVEVPLDLFRPILGLGRSEFDSDGPRIRITDGVGDCLTLVLDRSDAKITIARVPISRCIVHAEWGLPKHPD